MAKNYAEKAAEYLTGSCLGILFAAFETGLRLSQGGQI
jgi:hypothetical protein